MKLCMQGPLLILILQKVRVRVPIPFDGDVCYCMFSPKSVPLEYGVNCIESHHLRMHQGEIRSISFEILQTYLK